jgi:CubicO group peptidase (beta-lactamase class C family)
MGRIEPREMAVPGLLLVAVLALACVGSETEPSTSEDWSIDAESLERFVTGYMGEKHIPGVAVAILADSEVVFSAGYGWADIERRVPMTPDTVTNIASVTKTITAAALLQLRDEHGFSLEEAIDAYLPFEVRHPDHSEMPITFRHLLTHTASLDDGDAYDESYACGDPSVSLGDWLQDYLTLGGRYYDAEQNFLTCAPGEKYSYSNVGYGLIGHLVERISGVSLTDYTRERIFEPLGMEETGWYLSEFDPDRHATPYAWVEVGETLDNPLFGERNGETMTEASFVPFCPYSFYNLSDGLLRTSVNQLARFVLAHMNGGELEGVRILEEGTIAEIFSQQLDPSRIEDNRFVQGLTWRQREDEVGPAWGHSGGDPGVRTRVLFDIDGRSGVIVFANRATRVTPIVQRLFEEARS